MLYAGLDLSRKRLNFHLLDGEGATVAERGRSRTRSLRARPRSTRSSALSTGSTTAQLGSLGPPSVVGRGLRSRQGFVPVTPPRLLT